MKKILVAILLVVLSFGTLSAQTGETRNFYYGFRVGYNLSKINMTPACISESSVSGMNAGMIIGFPVGETQLVFEPGVLFSMKGGKTEYQLDGKKFTSDVRMLGFEVPFVLKYGFTLPTMTDITVSPLFGGFFDFGFGGKIKNDGQFVNVNTGQPEKVGDRDTYDHCFKRLDAGLRLGVGADIDRFYVEVAYDFGLVDLAKNDYGFTTLYPYDAMDHHKTVYNPFEDRAKSGTLCVSVGMNF